MIHLRKPSDRLIRVRLHQQRESRFTYDFVGATEGVPPKRFVINHARFELGTGRKLFQRAAQAMRSWAMFHLDLVEMVTDGPVSKDADVGILSRQIGFWALNFARVAYCLDEVEKD